MRCAEDGVGIVDTVRAHMYHKGLTKESQQRWERGAQRQPRSAYSKVSLLPFWPCLWSFAHVTRRSKLTNWNCSPRRRENHANQLHEAGTGARRDAGWRLDQHGAQPGDSPTDEVRRADFARFDMEHASPSMETLSNMALLARAMDFTLTVRPPQGNREWITRLLDAGVWSLHVRRWTRRRSPRRW
jgi:hypothetical protein